jgi:hypothetical protein
VQKDESQTDMMKLIGVLLQRFIMKTPKKKKKVNAVLIISFDTCDFYFQVWRFWTFASVTSVFCSWVLQEDSAFQMHGFSEIILEALNRFIFS